MKKILLSLSLLLIIFSISGCKDDDTIQVEGVIVYCPPPDNCNDYMIVINGDLFKPNKLTEEFMVNNLAITLSYTATSEKHNCGFGGYYPIININSINKK